MVVYNVKLYFLSQITIFYPKLLFFIRNGYLFILDDSSSLNKVILIMILMKRVLLLLLLFVAGCSLEASQGIDLNKSNIGLKEVKNNLNLITNESYNNSECVQLDNLPECDNLQNESNEVCLNNGTEKAEKKVVLADYITPEDCVIDLGSLENENVQNSRVEETDYSLYLTGRETIKLKYVLRGNTKYIDFDVYKGLNDYYGEIERSIKYYSVPPTKRDFVIKKIDNEMQKYFLKELVEKIKLETSNKDDQARIAISLVQQLSYDWESSKTHNLKDRYPYQVLYDQKGVCGEKSQLTAFLLRELGYGTVLFLYESEDHEAVGIKCPSEYSYEGTGYCFVENNAPSIITDSSGDYIGVGKLTSAPEIVLISEGESLESVSEEYGDGKKFQELISNGLLDESSYIKFERLVNKYGMSY